MDSNEIKRINELVLNKAKKYVPNFKKFDNGKTFDNLFYGGKTFLQVRLIDRSNPANTYPGKEIQFNVDLGKRKELESAIKTYNDMVKKIQKEVAEKEVSNFDRGSFYSFSSIGDTIGICHVYIVERNEKREKEEEKERMKYIEDDVCTRCRGGGCFHCEPHRFI